MCNELFFHSGYVITHPLMISTLMDICSSHCTYIYNISHLCTRVRVFKNYGMVPICIFITFIILVLTLFFIKHFLQEEMVHLEFNYFLFIYVQ